MRERIYMPAGLGGSIWPFRTSSTLRLHHHSELEFNLVISGRAKYIVKDRRHDIRPGTLIWFFPRQDHLLLERSADYRMWIACFKPGFVRKICTDEETRPLRLLDPPGDFCRHLDPETARQLDAVMHRAAELDRSRRAALDATLAYALTLAWELFRSAGVATAERSVHPAVERAARIIRDSNERLSVDEIAESVGLSASRLSRLFKRQTGVPLVRYRARVWLDRFLQLAERHPEADLLSLSLQAGFGSYPQFHRVFRSELGTSPAVWRAARMR
jgi:AraC-like DNA-binding protein